MLLGAIADDLTGATDLALMLKREGMRVLQVIGVPPSGFDYSQADAIVVALKSRTIPAADAVAMSLEALSCLTGAGAQQIIFKYCSTFDSTAEGNIGPVTDALMHALGADLTIVCPAFPANGRTVYKGHLFVGDMLLSESPMKDHPLTPMRDSNLVRLMQAQTRGRVGLVPHDVVARGAGAIGTAIAAAKEQGQTILVVDALDNPDLQVIAEAVRDFKLITGGSGIALGLPENFRKSGQLVLKRDDALLRAPEGRSVILAGSCSLATRGQIEAAIEAGYPVLKVDPMSIANGDLSVSSAVEFAQGSLSGIPLIYSSEAPDIVRQAQDTFGRDEAGQLVETFMSEVAIALRACGFSRFLIAGGETSGAVVSALGAKVLLIGNEIDPGVPWTLSMDDEQPVALALKSGNFGSRDFFIKAWSHLHG